MAIRKIVDEYAEYKTNLYVEGAYGCVVSEDGKNIYKDSIPVEAARKRLELEDIDVYTDSATLVTIEDGEEVHKTVLNPESERLVRRRDGKIQGLRAAGNNNRPFSYLLDQATGVLGVGRGDLKITAVGTTRDGARAYLQVRTNDKRDVEGMEYDPFVNFGMSYDGSLGIISISGDYIYSCANMVSASFGRKIQRKAKTKQTRLVTDEMIFERHSVALQLEQAADDFEEEIKKLVQTTVTDKQWHAFLDEVAPLTGPKNEELSKHKVTRSENMRGELNALYTSDERASQWHGTALGVAQAWNTYDLWERGTRGDTNAAVRMFDESLDDKAGSRIAHERAANQILNKVLATV